MASSRTFVIGSAIVLLIIVITVGGLAFKSWSRTKPLPASVLEQAQAGVSRNDDWKPISRQLDALDMVLVPAGCFTMGSTGLQLAEAFDSCERFFGSGRCQVDFVQSETPPHKICFNDPFWISRTEVTNRLYGNSSSTNMKTMYRGFNWPRETVTWQEAAQFCLSHHARLPTEAEWEFVARGPDNLIYPWGDEFDPERLISGRLSPAEAASIPGGVSWVGAFDMSGGISEWTADWYAPYAQPNAIESNLPEERQQRVIRGGSWFSFASFFVRTSHREPADPNTANSTIGFRCARDLD